MKILVRETINNTTNYIWKEVAKDDSLSSCCYRTIDGKYYSPMQILSVTGDFRKRGYVVCKGCGKLVHKNKLEKHYASQEASADCAKCDSVGIRRKQVVKTTRKITSEGAITEIKTITGTAVCENHYPTREVTIIDKNQYCKYFACRRKGTGEIYKDWVYEYPNAFGVFPTEKTAIEKGWKYKSANIYTTNNGKLWAFFDGNGILISFAIQHRNDITNFVYSDIYDKFFNDNGEFSFYGIAESSAARYMRSIRKLYED